MKLSVIVPVYNEKETLPVILDKIRKTPYEKEILIVDDCSTDGSREYLMRLMESLTPDDPVKIFHHERNMGKGGAIQTAIRHITGDITIIQDADLEYDPQQYSLLLDPILNNGKSVVYGSRFLGASKFSSVRQMIANRFLTLLTNVLFGCALTDMETCYKAVKSDILLDLHLISRRFDIEPEITAKILKKGFRIEEVPIDYAGRNAEKGKKISWKDGFSAVWSLIKWRFVV